MVLWKWPQLFLVQSLVLHTVLANPNLRNYFSRTIIHWRREHLPWSQLNLLFISFRSILFWVLLHSILTCSNAAHVGYPRPEDLMEEDDVHVITTEPKVDYQSVGTTPSTDKDKIEDWTSVWCMCKGRNQGSIKSNVQSRSMIGKYSYDVIISDLLFWNYYTDYHKPKN